MTRGRYWEDIGEILGRYWGDIGEIRINVPLEKIIAQRE
jgi:hypothetical protein